MILSKSEISIEILTQVPDCKIVFHVPVVGNTTQMRGLETSKTLTIIFTADTGLLIMSTSHIIVYWLNALHQSDFW